MKTKTVILGVALICFASFPLTSFADAIDATSLDSVAKSLEGASEQDIAVIKKIICNAGHGLDVSDPKQMDVAMARIRARLHGKTVRSLVLEVEMQQRGEAEVSRQKAESIVREYRTRWKNRAINYVAVRKGAKRDQVLELLGEPDQRSDLGTIENWLYHCDAAYNEEQIWILTITVQIVNREVSEVKRADIHRAIADTPWPKPLPSEGLNTADELTPSPK